MHFSHFGEGVIIIFYPATDVVKNQLPLPIDYRRGCIQVPAEHPPMPALAEEIKLLYL